MLLVAEEDILAETRRAPTLLLLLRAILSSSAAAKVHHDQENLRARTFSSSRLWDVASGYLSSATAFATSLLVEKHQRAAR